MNERVGVLLPYVTSDDPIWYKSYYDEMIKHGQEPSRNHVRYRDYGTLKYLMRGVAKYMPYVTDILLIVAMDSQVPEWVNRSTVRVIRHEDYIPNQFLPTFTSNTILSFIYRIPDLPDYLIRFNDDTFVMRDTSFNQFFKNGRPCVKFKTINSVENSSWRKSCRVIMELAAKVAGVKPENDGIVVPVHYQIPMLKTTLEKVGKLCDKDIREAVTFLRNEKNLNEYLFTLYDYYTNNYENVYPFETAYVDFKKNPGFINKTIRRKDIDLLCINDGTKLDPSMFASYKTTMQVAFSSILPTKCKYEK